MNYWDETFFSTVNKINTSAASAHAQLNHFETCSGFTDQFLAFQNNFLVSQIRDIVIPWNFLKYVSLIKEVDWWHNFKFLMTSKTDFCSVYYTSVALPSQWRHQLSSFHKGYPWYKFKVHIIPRSCGISGGAGCTPLFYMLTIVERRRPGEGLVATVQIWMECKCTKTRWEKQNIWIYTKQKHTYVNVG